MLHILLLILKIIGIVLLSILGILLLGIICALFVPVRYRIEAVRQEGEGQPPAAVRVKVTWLLHLINFLFCFDGAFFVRARIFLFTVFRMPKKEKAVDSRARQGQEVVADEKAAADKTEQTNSVSQERRKEAFEDTERQTEDRQEDKENAETFEETQDLPGFWDKLRVIPGMLQRLFKKIRGLFENIEYTINKFCDKIRSVSDTIEYYREVVEGEAFKRSFALCKDELTAVIRRLKPRKFEASLIIGMDDPASTGEILAVCGMLYPIFGGHVDVRGDFERQRLEGEVLIVGKLRMFTFLRTAVRIYFNKDIRKLYRLLKRRQ